VPVEVEMSDTDTEIYNLLWDLADQAKAEERYDEAGQFVHLMKMVCNTSEALLHTTSKISLPVMESINAANLKTSLSAKFEMVKDKILEIQSQGDKVVLFTKY